MQTQPCFRWSARALLLGIALSPLGLTAWGQETNRNQAGSPAVVAESSTSSPGLGDVLTPAQGRAVDRAVDRALAWIVSRQQPDGSFPTIQGGQPGVTAICVLALVSRGHLPGEGPYGSAIDKAVTFVLGCQADDGVLAPARKGYAGLADLGQTAAYNHAIGGLMLSELYGQTSGPTNDRIRVALDAAIKASLRREPQPKRHRDDEGGWRYYFRHQNTDSDLSVTSWQLMFLRSCKNAGYDVPAEPIDQAVEFVQRCYDPQRHLFWYALRGREKVSTRAMTGAGILSLSLAGRHQTTEARTAGDWILARPFGKYLERVGKHDRFFYGAFYCSQATFQLGGRYWEKFFPVMCKTLVENQSPDGSWHEEPGYDRIFGNVYSSAIAVLAISPRYQLLPIFQR